MIIFQGTKYYEDKSRGKDGGYHKSMPYKGKSTYLHRDIYSATYGNVPHGWVVHHRDEDPRNNDLANLQAVPRTTHMNRLHRPLLDYVCAVCDRPFKARYHPHTRYCGHTCSEKARRWRIKASG